VTFQVWKESEEPPGCERQKKRKNEKGNEWFDNGNPWRSDPFADRDISKVQMPALTIRLFSV